MEERQHDETHASSGDTERISGRLLGSPRGNHVTNRFVRDRRVNATIVVLAKLTFVEFCA